MLISDIAIAAFVCRCSASAAAAARKGTNARTRFLKGTHSRGNYSSTATEVNVFRAVVHEEVTM